MQAILPLTRGESKRKLESGSADRMNWGLDGDGELTQSNLQGKHEFADCLQTVVTGPQPDMHVQVPSVEP